MEQISKKFMSWASVLEPNTLEQARVTSTMPFIYPQLALMPDAHLGKGATVGSVIPTLGAIIPAAVGVDIGCGMIAVRTQRQVTDLDMDNRRAMREVVEAVEREGLQVSTVFAMHQGPVPWTSVIALVKKALN